MMPYNALWRFLFMIKTFAGWHIFFHDRKLSDVVKDPHIADDVARYRKHLQQLFDRH